MTVPLLPTAGRGVLRAAAPGFGLLLRAHRERAGWSMDGLGRLSGLDYSHISRLESGGRRPRRTTVLALARALRLPPAERDTLLAAAGFAPDDPVSLIADEPVVGALLATLRDEGLHPAARDTLRQLVALAVEQAERERGRED